MPSDNITNTLKNLMEKVLLSDNFTFLFDTHQGELIYYLAGWILCAAEKESQRRGQKLIVKYFEILLSNVICIDLDTVRSAKLPTGKIDHANC